MAADKLCLAEKRKTNRLNNLKFDWIQTNFLLFRQIYTTEMLVFKNWPFLTCISWHLTHMLTLAVFKYQSTKCSFKLKLRPIAQVK